ncbi:MAG: hypothetical protein J0I41_18140 [Filimonas sp.]|nr:hypothetical protein [Filimonas sp.]
MNTPNTVKKKKKWLSRVVIIFILLLSSFLYGRYYFVVGRGVNAGVLNYFIYKGYVFKTYEGKMILSGFKANIQSNEFEFSVVDEHVAKILSDNAGREIRVHYKEYLGALPWRGMQRKIVDSVLQVSVATGETIISPK